MEGLFSLGSYNRTCYRTTREETKRERPGIPELGCSETAGSPGRALSSSPGPQLVPAGAGQGPELDVSGQNEQNRGLTSAFRDWGSYGLWRIWWNMEMGKEQMKQMKNENGTVTPEKNITLLTKNFGPINYCKIYLYLYYMHILIYV